MNIFIFGNRYYEKDSALVPLLPRLRKNFPGHHFFHQDPTENFLRTNEPLIIIDTVDGIDKVTIFGNLDSFQGSKSITTHDYDLFTDLMLRKKLKTLPPLTIIGVPTKLNADDIIAALQTVIDRQHR